MKSMLIAANAVLPVAFMMLLGALLKQKKIIKDSSFRDFNWIVYHICLPVSLFNSIQGMDTKMLSNPRIIVFAYTILAINVIVPMILFSKMQVDDRKKAVMVQGVFRSNFIFLGIPILESIYGVGNTGPAPLLVSFVVPAFNIIAVLIFQYYSGKKGDLSETFKDILTNPLIIATIIGFLYKLSGISTPTVLAGILNQVVKMSTPLALLVLGGSFQLVSVRANLKLLNIITAGKLIIAPLVAVIAGVFMGYEGVELVALMAFFGSPASTSSFAMAMQMGMDEELAAQSVMMTTFAVIITMFGGITILSILGLM